MGKKSNRIKTVFTNIWSAFEADKEWILGFILLSFAWMGFISTFYKLIIGERWLDFLFKLLNENTLLNIPICICLIALLFKWVDALRLDKVHPLYNIFLVLFVSLLLLLQPAHSSFEINYAKPFYHVDFIDYRVFFSILLGFVFCKTLEFSIINMAGAANKDSTKENEDSITQIKQFLVFFVFAVVSVFLFSYLDSGFDFPQSWIQPFRLMIGILLLWFLNHIVFYRDQIIKWLNKILKKEPVDTQNDLPGFSLDYDENIEQNQPNHLQKYADFIKKRLMSTTMGESFAVGITGEWGAGKTSFLHLLKNKIGNKAIVVEFNPWMCHTPEQITSDFFSTLRNQLSKGHSSLSRSIRLYAKCLNSISIPVASTFTIKLPTFTSESSLKKMKEDLSKRFSRLKKRVVVIIDDIDRLEREEVFEVLRLIRNTADLNNIIYIVAYDKNYVTSVLKEDNDSDKGINFLEKIFQIEIQLPSVPKENIWNTLCSELSRQLNKDINNDNEFKNIAENKKLVLDILNTYRRAKRFARLFSLNYMYLKSDKDVQWSDVFWLDLLQMHDKRTFDILWREPETLLNVNDNLFTYNKEESEVNITDRLLKCLFDSSNNNDIRNESIRRVESFNMYFTLKIPFIKKDIDKLFSMSEDEVDQQVRNWIDSYHINAHDILEVMSEYDCKDLPENQKTIFLKGFLFLVYYHKKDGRKYSDEDEKINKIVQSFIDNGDENSKTRWYTVFENWVRDILKRQILRSWVMDIVKYFDSLFPDKIEKLYKVVINNYCDNNFSESVLYNEQSELYQLISIIPEQDKHRQNVLEEIKKYLPSGKKQLEELIGKLSNLSTSGENPQIKDAILEITQAVVDNLGTSVSPVKTSSSSKPKDKLIFEDQIAMERLEKSALSHAAYDKEVEEDKNLLADIQAEKES